MGLDVSSDPVRNGLFWRERDQMWLPADWWLDRLGINDRFLLLRVESLKSDFLKILHNHQPISCASRLNVRLVRSSNRNKYRRRLDEWFNLSDLSAVYAMNPKWAELETKVYGCLLTDV